MRTTLLTLISAIGLAAVPHGADASAPVINTRLWTSTGNGCVVADESAGLYDSRLAGIGFLSGKVGTIREYCPVAISTNGSSPVVAGLALSANISSTSGASVSATLWRVADGSNAANTVCQVVASPVGLGQNYCTVPGGVFVKNNSYWVEIDVVRSTTTIDPEALAVFIFN